MKVPEGIRAATVALGFDHGALESASRRGWLDIRPHVSRKPSPQDLRRIEQKRRELEQGRLIDVWAGKSLKPSQREARTTAAKTVRKKAPSQARKRAAKPPIKPAKAPRNSTRTTSQTQRRRRDSNPW